MDTLISKGKAKLKQVRAKASGMTGVFSTLTQQHGEVEALLARVQDDADKRRALWPTIRMELLSHERAEIQQVYPALRYHEATRSVADQHDAEANDLEQLIQRLDATEISSALWGELFDQLVDTVLAHATEEETEMFPLAQDTLGKARSKELDSAFLATKQRIASSIRTIGVLA